MELSKNERVLAIAVGAVVVLLTLDHYLLTPMLDDQAALEAERDKVSKEITNGRKQVQKRKEMLPQWKDMLTAGLKDDPANAESQVLHAIRDWARETGLSLSSLKPERPESKDTLREVQVQATATGNLDGIARFLWKAQSAKFPLKVTEFQTSSRVDANESLTMQIKVSTLYMVREKIAAPTPVAAGDAK